ncbi:alpha/beta hydrolase family protein [Paucibacter soli]|uniref:alpha/beta hydrolase family protein n=1 Tax=Paucibacter soli TaxID=3133433 RepID=UPI00309FBA29
MGLCLALLGCAGPRGQQRSQAPAPQAQHLANAQALAASGYRSPIQQGTSFSPQHWLLRGESLPLALTLPSANQQGQVLPLVVYLPGLGESEQAGALWRQAWARAGYAVLSVQPLDEDALAWGSELARAAEFRTLARERHAASAARLARLEALLQEARRRAAAGDPDCARLDFGRMAIAGYDLGAQSALLLAPQFRAGILLSPLVAPGEEDAARYAGIQVPVLSITARQDLDPSGFVASAEARRLPFRLMPAGAKYLLLLDGANHARLAGHSDEELDALAQDRMLGQGARGAERRGRGGTTRGNMQLQQQQQPSLPSARGLPLREAHGKSEFDAVIATTTVAFLDAHLRERPAARQWLQAEAQAWLGELGQWQQR